MKEVTHDIVENSDPIWQANEAHCESMLVGEWEDLHENFFHMYDGSHRIKTWGRRIHQGNL